MSWTSFLDCVLANSLVALCLAVALALVGRYVRSAALLHLLWLAVLIKLVTVPVLRLEVGPVLDAGSAGTGAPVYSEIGAAAPAAMPGVTSVFEPQASQPAPRSTLGRAPETETRPRDARSIAPFVLAFWIFGTLVMTVLTARGVMRFRRIVGRAPLADAALEGRAQAIAARLGMERTPRVRVVPTRMPPSVWGRPGAAEVLVPHDLIASLSDPELDALLTHELAHVRRRDHWARVVELIVTCLYWWNPVAWWARRELRRLEERACDVMVRRLLPDQPRAYAEALVKTIEFMSAQRAPGPALATGVDSRHVKERIRMILKHDLPALPSRRTRLAAGIAIVLAIAVSPTWLTSAPASDASVPADDTAAPAEPTRAPADQEHAETLLELEHKRLELENQLRQLEITHMKLEIKATELEQARNLRECEGEIDRLVGEGRHAEAQETERRCQEMQEQAKLERERLEIYRSQVARRFEADAERRALELRREQALAKGEAEEVAEIDERLEQLDLALRKLDLEEMEAHVAIESKRLEIEAKRLEKEAAEDH